MGHGAGLAEIERLYARERSKLLRAALAITGDVETAADAVHDAFVECIRTRDNFRGDGPVEGWVWRAVSRRALRLAADRRRRALRDDEEMGAAGEVGSHDDVRDAIRELPERERLVLFLTYYADFDYERTATVLEISPGTVGAALHSARNAVRRRLEELVR